MRKGTEGWMSDRQDEGDMYWRERRGRAGTMVALSPGVTLSVL